MILLMRLDVSRLQSVRDLLKTIWIDTVCYTYVFMCCSAMQDDGEQRQSVDGIDLQVAYVGHFLLCFYYKTMPEWYGHYFAME